MSRLEKHRMQLITVSPRKTVTVLQFKRDIHCPHSRYSYFGVVRQKKNTRVTTRKPRFAKFSKNLFVWPYFFTKNNTIMPLQPCYSLNEPTYLSSLQLFFRSKKARELRQKSQLSSNFGTRNARCPSSV